MSDFAPETGPDGRPRPRFGEYATPEEQRARIQQPDATFALDAGVAPPHAASPAGVPSAPPFGAGQATTSPQGAGRPAARPVDRIVTIALLAYGAVNVVVTAISFFDLAGVIGQAMTVVGIEGEFTNVDAARLWGPIAAIVLVIGYLVTLAFSLQRLRVGKLAWWLPIAGAVITFVLVYICLAVVILGDPAFTQAVTSRQ